MYEFWINIAEANKELKQTLIYFQVNKFLNQVCDTLIGGSLETGSIAYRKKY